MFHLLRLFIFYVQELPEGNWYCPQCICQICADLVDIKDSSRCPGTLKCFQCENRCILLFSTFADYFGI